MTCHELDTLFIIISFIVCINMSAIRFILCGPFRRWKLSFIGSLRNEEKNEAISINQLAFSSVCVWIGAKKGEYPAPHNLNERNEKSERSTGSNRPEKYGNRPLIFMYIYFEQKNTKRSNLCAPFLCYASVFLSTGFGRVRYTTAIHYIIIMG